MFTCWLGRFCQSQLFLGWLIKRSNLWLIKAPPDNTVLSFNHLLSLYENQTSKWLNLFFLFFFFCQSRKEWKKEIKKKKSACLADLALSEVHTSRRERSWTTFVMQTGTFGYQMQDVVYPVQRGTYFACLCWLLSIKPCCDSATLKINNLCYSHVLHYAPFFKRRSFPERHLLKRREGNKTLANVFIIITWRQSNHGTLEDQLKYL